MQQCAVYADEEVESRARFVEFFADILPLIETSHCYAQGSRFYQATKKWPDSKQMAEVIRKAAGNDNTCTYPNEDEIADPRQIMTNFCIKYPIEYARREVWDFFQSAESYQGPLRSRVSKFAFSDYYLKLLTIVEASYALCRLGADSE